MAAVRWLHLCAAVLFVGFPVVSALVFLPLFRRHMPPEDLGEFIAAYRDRASMVVWFGIGLFAVTGISLFLYNPNYNGDLWDVTANGWTVFITIKHTLILGLAPFALYLVNVVAPRLAEALMTGAPESETLTRRFRFVSVCWAILGIIVLFLIAGGRTAGL
jgi:uncharacterized membrane protein